MNHRFAVSSNNSRTRSVGLPATLTHDEWTRTVAFMPIRLAPKNNAERKIVA